MKARAAAFTPFARFAPSAIQLTNVQGDYRRVQGDQLVFVVSGMTDPRNIIGFLDFFGQWNPTVAPSVTGGPGQELDVLVEDVGDVASGAWLRSLWP